MADIVSPTRSTVLSPVLLLRASSVASFLLWLLLTPFTYQFRKEKRRRRHQINQAHSSANPYARGIYPAKWLPTLGFFPSVLQGTCRHQRSRAEAIGMQGHLTPPVPALRNGETEGSVEISMAICVMLVRQNVMSAGTSVSLLRLVSKDCNKSLQHKNIRQKHLKNLYCNHGVL